MRSLLFTVLFCIVFIQLHAQVWDNATIVLANGDSVRGQVEGSLKSVSVSTINFKALGKTIIQTYTTEQVSSYVLTDKHTVFEVVSDKIIFYALQPVQPGGNPIVSEEPIRVFAEVLMKSTSVSLYQVIDKYEDDRFFVKKGNELIQLRNIEYQRVQDGKVFNVKNEAYKEKVASIIMDCKTKAVALSYDARVLTKVISAYASCKDGLLDFRQQNVSDPVNLGVFALTALIAGEHANGYVFGGNLQMLARKKPNRFLWLEAGAVGHAWTEPGESRLYLAAFGGSYLGRRQIQPLVYAGVGFIGTQINVGGGLAYRKSIILSGTASYEDRTLGILAKLAFFPRFKANRNQ